MPFPLCVGSMRDCPVFSFICALPSPSSAGSCPPLFGGSQVLRRSPTSPERACPSCGSVAFTDRPSPTAEGVLEISRFSCMLFLSVRGLYRLRRTGQPLAITRPPVLPSSYSEGSRHPDLPAFRSSITPPTNASGLRFAVHLAMHLARLEVRMESLSPFPWGSCIPYNMPVYPGALRIAGDSPAIHIVRTARLRRPRLEHRLPLTSCLGQIHGSKP